MTPFRKGSRIKDEKTWLNPYLLDISKNYCRVGILPASDRIFWDVDGKLSMGSSARVLARWGHHPGTSAGDTTQARRLGTPPRQVGWGHHPGTSRRAGDTA
jgi:hypothetical protein